MRINLFSIFTFFCAIALIGISGSEAFGQTNLALKATAKQSSINEWNGLKGVATNGIDGKFVGGLANIVETKHDKSDSWFEVDLGNYYKIDKIVIHPRTDCCLSMFKSTYAIVTDQPLEEKPMLDDAKIGNSSTYFKFYDTLFVDNETNKKEIETNGKIGRYVRLQIKGWGAIELSEIEIWGNPTPVANHKPIAGKAWNAVLESPFDPNYPNFRGATGEYLSTLQRSPKVVGIKNSAGSFDIAFQDNFGDSKLIKVNSYEKDGSGFKKNTAKSMNLTGLGVFGGFTKDAAGNRYIFTGTPWSNRGEAGISKVYKNDQVLWNGKFYDAGSKSIGDVQSFMHEGGSRLVIGGNSLLITANIAPAHPYQVILDTQDASKNNNRAFFESLYQHNFGQRALFDGKDFVVMENRDHDVSVTLSKLNPAEVLPLSGKNDGHANEFVKRIFSVYSHTNFGNNTYLELGNVEKGLNDDGGYLVLFASERDWDYKLTGYNYNQNNYAPNILSPRDIGLVHVKKDFNSADKVNWLNGKGDWYTQCPPKVDNSNFVNSIGAAKTVKYKAANDGWNWQTYSPACQVEINAGQTERTLVTSGVNWITNLGASYSSKVTGEFTSVNHPKLVRIAANKYIVLWEEWKADSVGYGQPKKTYITTKAALITLGDKNGKVEIQAASTKDLGKIRLMPGDDAFEFDGKAAWAVGDVSKGKLMFYTVDGSLNVGSFELEI